MTRFVPDADHAHLIPADAPSLAEQLEQAQNAAVGLEGELHAVEIERDALIAKLNGAATKVREFAETWLFDGERDCPMVAYEPAFDLAGDLEFEAKFQ